MTQRISAAQRSKMQNPIIQFFKFLYLNIKILKIVAGGHGGTRTQVHQSH
jgi:hypothetical protein